MYRYARVGYWQALVGCGRAVRCTGTLRAISKRWRSSPPATPPFPRRPRYFLRPAAVTDDRTSAGSQSYRLLGFAGPGILLHGRRRRMTSCLSTVKCKMQIGVVVQGGVSAMLFIRGPLSHTHRQASHRCHRAFVASNRASNRNGKAGKAGATRGWDTARVLFRYVESHFFCPRYRSVRRTV